MLPTFFKQLISSKKNLPNDDHNEVNISKECEVKQTQIKRKHVFHLQSRRKLVHELYITKKRLWKDAYLWNISEKFKYFSNNVLSVPCEIIFSKYTKYDFLTLI